MDRAVDMPLPHNAYLDIVPLKPSFAHLRPLPEPQLNIPKPTLLPPETGSCNLERNFYTLLSKKKLNKREGKVDGSVQLYSHRAGGFDQFKTLLFTD